MGWWNFAEEKLNSRAFKRCVKERQIGIFVEPAAEVDSTFLRWNIYVIPSPPSPQMTVGHSWVQKRQRMYAELQVLSDFHPVLFQEQ